MYLAQCVEQAIYLNLVFFDLYPKAGTTIRSKKEWFEAYEAYEERELRKTMGRLIQKLKEKGKSTGSVEAKLDECLTKRNWLAHSYFPDRGVDLTYESGREKMIRELEGTQALFRDKDQEITKLTEPVMQSYGLTEEKLQKLMHELQTEHRSKR